jgi:hypothetical protein
MTLPVDLRTKETKGSDRRSSFRKAPRWRTWALAGLVLLGGAHATRQVATKHAPGCPFYRPVTGRMLVAHAAGGLPDRMYPNSIEALDRSYARGLRIFEMDFYELPFGLMRAGHDPSDVIDPREAWISQVLAWLRRHPDARLMVDMKTDNVRGLRLIASEAQDLRQRIIPLVYTEGEYAAVRSVGLSLPVYAIFHRDDPNWLAFANGHDFAAVALAQDRIDQISKVRHPVIVYTYDVMSKASGARGVITNCMVPAKGSSGTTSL